MILIEANFCRSGPHPTAWAAGFRDVRQRPVSGENVKRNSAFVVTDGVGLGPSGSARRNETREMNMLRLVSQNYGLKDPLRMSW